MSTHGRGIEILAAIATLLTIYLSLGDYPWYPEWIDVGAATLPTIAVGPTIFAVVVLLRRVSLDDSGPRVRSLGLSVFGAITLALSLYAIWNLNTSSGGVYWAAFYPLLTGGLLAVATLLGHAVRLAERAS